MEMKAARGEGWRVGQGSGGGGGSGGFVCRGTAARCDTLSRCLKGLPVLLKLVETRWWLTAETLARRTGSAQPLPVVICNRKVLQCLRILLQAWKARPFATCWAWGLKVCPASQQHSNTAIATIRSHCNAQRRCRAASWSSSRRCGPQAQPRADQTGSESSRRQTRSSPIAACPAGRAAGAAAGRRRHRLRGLRRARRERAWSGLQLLCCTVH